MMLQPIYVDEVIRRALAEDLPYGDATADHLIPADAEGTARWVAKADGVICGLTAALRVFDLLGGGVSAEISAQEGGRVAAGAVIAVLRGNVRCLLKGERTALNLLQHMSGIATATADAVALTAGTKAIIADTRKTLPGLRALQKYAVTIGGGRNHRFGLSDGAMLKDNHIDAAGGIQAAVAALRQRLGHMIKLEVETRNLDEVRQAVQAGADVIMLDNMTPENMKAAVALVGGRALVEASGNVTPERLAAIAGTGVDIISIGALTHSVTAMDISMQFLI